MPRPALQGLSKEMVSSAVGLALDFCLEGKESRCIELGTPIDTTLRQKESILLPEE